MLNYNMKIVSYCGSSLHIIMAHLVELKQLGDSINKFNKNVDFKVFENEYIDNNDMYETINISEIIKGNV